MAFASNELPETLKITYRNFCVTVIQEFIQSENLFSPLKRENSALANAKGLIFFAKLFEKGPELLISSSSSNLNTSLNNSLKFYKTTFSNAKRYVLEETKDCREKKGIIPRQSKRSKPKPIPLPQTLLENRKISRGNNQIRDLRAEIEETVRKVEKSSLSNREKGRIKEFLEVDKITLQKFATQMDNAKSPRFKVFEHNSVMLQIQNHLKKIDNKL